MKIIKYEKTNQTDYKIHLENNKIITLSSDIILKYNLLYKQEIDNELMEILEQENNYHKIYTMCLKYLSLRIRSVFEMEEYLKRKNIDSDISKRIISDLLNKKELDDEFYTKAFINDKIKFTSMGPYRIIQELKKNKISDALIDKYIYNIDEDILLDKINKIITKMIKSNKKKVNFTLKNKIYQKLIGQGFDSSMVLNELNKYDF